MSERPDVSKCAFCLKSAAEVRCLIAGPSVSICNECVQQSAEIVIAREVRTKLNAMMKGTAPLSKLLAPIAIDQSVESAKARGETP